MLELDPHSSKEIAFALHKAQRFSGLTLSQIAEKLQERYGVSVSGSALSHAIHRGTMRVQRAVQILEICGVTELHIKSRE